MNFKYRLNQIMRGTMMVYAVVTTLFEKDLQIKDISRKKNMYKKICVSR